MLVLAYCSCSTTLHKLIANQRVLSPTPYPLSRGWIKLTSENLVDLCIINEPCLKV